MHHGGGARDAPEVDSVVNPPLIVYVTDGQDPLKLDRLLVAKFNGVWHWKDLYVWRKLTEPPKIDLDMTQRWFSYTNKTMVRVREELTR